MAMMIQKFHRLIQSKVVWIGFLILVCIAFVGLYLPGMDTYNQQVADAAVGELDGEQIDPQELRHHYFSTYLSVALSTLSPPRITDEVDAQLRRAAWRRLAALREAEKQGFSATNQEVIDRIRSDRLFSNNGQFSQPTYNAFVQQFLAAMGVTEVQFEQHVREEIVISKMRVMVNQASLISPREVRRRFNMVRDQFAIEYALLSPDRVADDVEVDADAAKAYFEANPEPFRLSEQVEVSLVQFNTDEFLDRVAEFTEADLRDEYDRNIDQYTYLAELEDEEPAVPEDEPATDDVELEVEPVEPGESTEVAEDEVAEDEEDASVISPAPMAQRTQPFEEVEDEVLASLRKRHALNLAAEAATEFVVQLAPDRDGQAAEFETILAKFEREAVALAPFTESEPILGTGAGQRLNTAAFALNNNPEEYLSDAVIGEDAVYVLKLNNRIPSRIPDYDEVADAVMEAARESAVQDALLQMATELRQKAEEAVANNGSFAETLKAEGLTVEETGDMTAATGLLDLEYSDAVIRAIRDFNPGEVADPVPVEGGLLLSYVANRTAADPAEFVTLKDQIETTLRRRQATVIFQQWQEHLLSDAVFKDPRDLPPVDEEADDEADTDEG